MTDDLGITRAIDRYSLAMWSSFIRASVQRGHERELTLKMGDPTRTYGRTCVDAVKKVLASAKVSQASKNLLLVTACNALWTKTRAAEAGYDVGDALCELCQNGPDTLHHRLWVCQKPEVCAARDAIAKPWVIRAALAAGPTSSLYCRGMWDHPAQHLPMPTEEAVMQVWDAEGNEVPQHQW